MFDGFYSFLLLGWKRESCVRYYEYSWPQWRVLTNGCHGYWAKQTMYVPYFLFARVLFPLARYFFAHFILLPGTGTGTYKYSNKSLFSNWFPSTQEPIRMWLKNHSKPTTQAILPSSSTCLLTRTNNHHAIGWTSRTVCHTSDWLFSILSHLRMASRCLGPIINFGWTDSMAGSCRALPTGVVSHHHGCFLRYSSFGTKVVGTSETRANFQGLPEHKIDYRLDHLD